MLPPLLHVFIDNISEGQRCTYCSDNLDEELKANEGFHSASAHYVPILEIIIEDVISEYAEAKEKNPEYIRFTPQWYLTPLLRVCRMWYAVCARYLYRTISIGSHAPFDFPAREGESSYQTIERRRVHIAARQARTGHEVAKDLYRMLATSSRMVALVERLQLGIESTNGLRETEWTQMNIRILQLCPNVKHVEIRGFEQSGLHALVGVLKEKSLVTFCISTRRLNDPYRRRGGHVSQIFDMMQKWPKLQSIRVEDFLNDEMANDPEALDTSQVSCCCPDLTEIVITGAALHASELNLIRSMCSSNVAKLSILLYGIRVGGNGNAAVVALCNCLRAWSPTLQYFKIDVRGLQDSYPLLEETISSLRELRELQFVGMMLDFGSISNLPRLERFSCRSLYKMEEVRSLSRHLDVPEKFLSLNHIVLFRGRRREPPNKLPYICRMRNIQLQKCWSGFEMTTDFLL